MTTTPNPDYANRNRAAVIARLVDTIAGIDGLTFTAVDAARWDDTADRWAAANDTEWAAAAGIAGCAHLTGEVKAKTVQAMHDRAALLALPGDDVFAGLS